LQQGRQSCGVRVEHTERAEDNDARPAEVSVGQRAEIDERILDAQLSLIRLDNEKGLLDPGVHSVLGFAHDGDHPAVRLQYIPRAL